MRRRYEIIVYFKPKDGKLNVKYYYAPYVEVYKSYYLIKGERDIHINRKNVQCALCDKEVQIYYMKGENKDEKCGQSY